MIRPVLPSAVSCAAIASAAHAGTSADWTVDTSQPAGTAAVLGPYAAEVGLGSAAGTHASSSTVYSFAGSARLGEVVQLQYLGGGQLLLVCGEHRWLAEHSVHGRSDQ